MVYNSHKELSTNFIYFFIQLIHGAVQREQYQMLSHFDVFLSFRPWQTNIWRRIFYYCHKEVEIEHEDNEQWKTFIAKLQKKANVSQLLQADKDEHK